MLWSILLHNGRQHYPWDLEVQEEGREAFWTWMGDDFEKAMEEGLLDRAVLNVLKGGREVHVLAMGHVEQYGTSQVTGITKCLAAHQHVEEGTVQV
jgi:hypothetical protein